MKVEHHEIIHQHEDNHWWYRVRRELVHDLIEKYFPGRVDLEIADIGAGAGALCKEMEQHGNAIAVDPSAHAIEYCKARGIKQVMLGGADHTGLPSGAFDLVTCLDVLEHLENEGPALHEIRRLLKPGGVAIIFVPAFMFLWGVTDVASQHYRRYRLPELESKVTAEGFTTLRRSYFNTIFFPLIALLRIGVRLLHIPVRSEVSMGNSLTNNIAYAIFSLERRTLKYLDFPFGVSIMLVAKK